jgi:hypothetical protein
MRLDLRAFLAGTLLFLALGTAEAQFRQYTPPGGPEAPPESRREKVEREMEEARFRLGPVRIVPLFGLSDVAYQRSLSGPVETPSDVNATVEAGVRAYLRTGPKVVWNAQVAPQYVWWRKQSEQRRVNGRYDATLFGFFNRLTAELNAGREQEQQIYHPEVLERVNARQDRGRLAAEVELTGALSAFAVASLARQKSLADEAAEPRTAALELLDREERVARVGLRWRRKDGLAVGLGVERSEVDFEKSALDRSNSGIAPVVEVLYDRPRLFVQADVAARSLEARQGAAFLPYDRVTGHAAVGLRTLRVLTWSVYGSRNLVYSLASDHAYLDDDRLGTALQIRVIRDLATGAFVETGRNRYTAFGPEVPERNEDVSSYGGQIGWNVRGLIQVSLQAVRTEIDSNLPDLDRSYSSVGVSVRLATGE